METGSRNLMLIFFSQRNKGERGAAAERRHPAVGAGVQGEALRADSAVQEQQQEGHTAAAAAGREKVVRGDRGSLLNYEYCLAFPVPHQHTAVVSKLHTSQANSLHYTFIRSAIVADVISCLSDLHISLYIYR